MLCPSDSVACFLAKLAEGFSSGEVVLRLSVVGLLVLRSKPT